MVREIIGDGDNNNGDSKCSGRQQLAAGLLTAPVAAVRAMRRALEDESGPAGPILTVILVFCQATKNADFL